MNLEQKLQTLQNILGQYDKIAVAFSGGVDSSLLLKVARDQLGPSQVLALTAVSPFFPRREQQESQVMAVELGVRQELLEIDLLQSAEVVRNDSRRCYYCKQLLMRSCLKRAEESGFSILVEGSNLDDLADYRPGKQAVEELGIASPLVTAGLNKQEVRDLSRLLGLSTATKPAFACLASRIPYGRAITLRALAEIENCESFLQQQGFDNFRVRHHGSTARIEVPVANLPDLIREPLRSRLVAHCKQAGFHYVSVDLEGYRSGSLNEKLF